MSNFLQPHGIEPVNITQRGVSVATDYDPSVTIELIAVALNRSTRAVEFAIKDGRIPPHNAKITKKLRGWKLSTLRAWNPRVAHRIDCLLIAAA